VLKACSWYLTLLAVFSVPFFGCIISSINPDRMYIMCKNIYYFLSIKLLQKSGLCEIKGHLNLLLIPINFTLNKVQSTFTPRKKLSRGIGCMLPVFVRISTISAFVTYEQLSRNFVTTFCPAVRTNVVIPSRLQFEITKWQTPEVRLHKL
jgi:hypothetical protein